MIQIGIGPLAIFRQWQNHSKKKTKEPSKAKLPIVKKKAKAKLPIIAKKPQRKHQRLNVPKVLRQGVLITLVKIKKTKLMLQHMID